MEAAGHLKQEGTGLLDSVGAAGWAWAEGRQGGGEAGRWLVQDCCPPACREPRAQVVPSNPLLVPPLSGYLTVTSSLKLFPPKSGSGTPHSAYLTGAVGVT